MDHAARDGEAAAAHIADVSGQAAGEKMRTPSRVHFEKNADHADAAKSQSKTIEPDKSDAKARGHDGARTHAAAREAHAMPTANPAGLVGLIFESEHAFRAAPSAAAPVCSAEAKSVSSSGGESEVASHLAQAKHPSTPNDAASPIPPAPPAAAGSSGAVKREPQEFEPSVPVGIQQASPPAAATPDIAATAILAVPPNNHGGAASAAKPDEKAADGTAKVGSSRLGQVQTVQPPALQNVLPPQLPGVALPAPPVPGVPAVAMGQAATQAGAPAAAPPAGAPVPPTPSALAAAVLAMHIAGDHSTILRLDPAGLGSLTVHVSMGQASLVNVQFVPSVSQTAHLLNNNLDDLRQAMTAAGIALGQTSVSSDGGHAGGNGGGKMNQAYLPAAGSRANPPARTVAGISVLENRSGGISAYA